MKERLKRIRKELDLTQQAFADRLGISRNNIAGYETGKSEPGDAVVSLICREFNVNEEWLRNGNGEMLIELSEEEEIADLAYELLDPKGDTFYLAVLELIHTYKELTPDSKQVIRETAAKFLDNLKKRKGD